MASEIILPFDGKQPGLPPCTCDGITGWYLVEHPDGRPVARPCSGCVSRRLVRQFGNEGAKTWDTWVPRPELARGVEDLRAWRGGDEWSCLLYSKGDAENTGAGKSHACQAVAHEWVMRGERVRYIGMPDFIEDLFASFGDSSVTVPNIAEFDGLLILDDVGLGRQPDVIRSLLERVGFHRRRYNLPTLITTNQDLVKLHELYPRLEDRLSEGLCIAWSASSWRKR